MAINKRNGVEAADAKLHLNKMNSTAQLIRLGDVVACQKGSVKALYDFSTDGGAVGTINLKNPDDLLQSVTLPNKAIITTAYVDIITAMSSTGNNGTIALNANSAGDLLAAVDADTLSGVAACIPVGTAATAIKLTAERTLTVAIATNALLGGKFMLFVEYMVSL